MAIHDQLRLPEIDSSDRDWFSLIEKRRTRKNGIGEGLECNRGRPAGLFARLGAVVAVSPRRAAISAPTTERQERRDQETLRIATLALAQ